MFAVSFWLEGMVKINTFRSSRLEEYASFSSWRDTTRPISPERPLASPSQRAVLRSVMRSTTRTSTTMSRKCSTLLPNNKPHAVCQQLTSEHLELLMMPTNHCYNGYMIPLNEEKMATMRWWAPSNVHAPECLNFCFVHKNCPTDLRSNNLFSSEATENVSEMVRIASDHIWTTSTQVGCYGAPGRAVAWIRHWIRFPRYLRDLQRHRRHMSVSAQRRFLLTPTSTVEQLFYRAEKNYLRPRKITHTLEI